MKREDLKQLNVPDDAIAQIMELHGKDIARHKTTAETAQARVTELTQQMEQRDKDIAALQKLDAQGLQAKLDELQASYDKEREAWAAKEAQRAYEDRRRDFFADIQFADDYARRGVLAEFDAQKFEYTDGDGFRGAKAWLDGVREKSPGTFAAASGNPVPHVVTGTSNPSGAPTSLTGLSYADKVKLKRDQPDLYKSLKENAKTERTKEDGGKP